MSAKPIALASDHAGYALKEKVKEWLKARGYEALDLGAHSLDSVDYPDFGTAVGEAIASGKAERGVIVCGSGIGISIAANRNPAVRAALCQSGLMARLSRQHNDANVLALGARLIGDEVAIDCLNEFLDTPFEGGRHQRRVDKLGIKG
ncbi:ribose 5-phosphate isomerase B [Gimibacter soli]|uniref:Ribose 5-phosphate isomerase B n=1 Tax=Gimibacter soli TaxID=3024400 RepID=A0AAE9XTF6_9PROT|nr:ribose 5-phosphate isomerase B [Gimibacter soli]WCL52998.1 ribose 5-phosphate isomerase B [Gimibacter soli]